MELERLFGLPAHPLLVHVPVVLVPLAALGVVLLVARPSWVGRYGWLVLAGAGLGALGAVLAAGSGEGLEESVRGSDALERHAELGETARLVSVLFFLVVAAFVLFAWWRRRRGDAAVAAKVRNVRVVGSVLSVLAVVGAVGATVTIVQAGHQGASVTWDEVDERSGDGAAPTIVPVAPPEGAAASG